MSIAVVDEAAGTLTYLAVGANHFAVVPVTGKTVRRASGRGVVGAGLRTLRPETLQLSAGDIVLLTSDGISERFDVSSLASERAGDNGALAQSILDQWRSETDDASVMTYRYLPAIEAAQ